MATTKELTLQEVLHLLAQTQSQELYQLGSLFQEYSKRKFEFQYEGGTIFQADRLQESKTSLAVRLLAFIQL